MASTTSNLPSEAILAVLREAEAAGSGKVTRTALIKYLYLLDLFNAEETGEALTKSEWKFLHFGPFAASLSDQIDFLSSVHKIQAEGGGGSNKDYTLFCLSDHIKPRSLQELGVSLKVISKVGQSIREYKGRLNALLDWIYFESEPMREAQPGDILSFENLAQFDYKRDARPIKPVLSGGLSAAKRKRAQELIAALAVKAAARSQDPYEGYTQPIDDDIYQAARYESDATAGVEGNYNAELVFASRHV